MSKQFDNMLGMLNIAILDGRFPAAHLPQVALCAVFCVRECHCDPRNSCRSFGSEMLSELPPRYGSLPLPRPLGSSRVRRSMPSLHRCI
jgi:hypothetical protein